MQLVNDSCLLVSCKQDTAARTIWAYALTVHNTVLSRLLPLVALAYSSLQPVRKKHR